MTARATDALAIRNIIADDFKHHSLMHTITEGTLHAQFGAMALRNGTVNKAAAGITKALEDTITRHPVFWINRDMQTLAMAAAEKLRPEDTVFHASNTPCHRGLLVFAEPLTGMDIRGRTTRTHAVTWTRTGSTQMILAYWVHKHDMFDDANYRTKHDMDRAEFFDIMPDYQVWHTVVLEEGVQIPKGITLETGTILPVDIPLVMDGKGGIVPPDDYDLDGVEFSHGQDLVARIMFSIWYLMGQTIADVQEEKAPRPLARASKRLDLIPLVSVIVLRYAKKQYLGTGSVEWSHRWLRRGFWRNQAYKDRPGGEWLHRPVYIHETVCGPADKPLVIKDKVTALVR
jgi:hypothetical protein